MLEKPRTHQLSSQVIHNIFVVETFVVIRQKAEIHHKKGVTTPSIRVSVIDNEIIDLLLSE